MAKKKKRKLTKAEAKRVRKVKRSGKLVFSFFFTVAVLSVLLIAALNFNVCEFSKDSIITLDELDGYEFDCVLVLGAGIRDGQPTPMLEERLDYGVRAYNTGCAPKIIMSGDHGQENYDEVNVMKNYALEAGVTTDDVFMDHAGFSTYESMYRARDIFNVKKVLIITQRYHLYRAIYDAKKLGLEAYGLAAEKLTYSPAKLLKDNTREALARVKDTLWCIIQPEPTYLGETIDISASGTVTDDKTDNK